MGFYETDIRSKLNLVIDKLLNLGEPENGEELEEKGGQAIGYFKRDFGIQEWDWPQGVGLYGLLKIMQYDKSEEYKEFLIKWYKDNISVGLPSRNINTTAPLLTLAELNETLKNEEFEKLKSSLAIKAIYDRTSENKGRWISACDKLCNR